MPLPELYRRSGLTSDDFRFWLNELESRRIIETAFRDGEEYVALTGKTSG